MARSGESPRSQAWMVGGAGLRLSENVDVLEDPAGLHLVEVVGAHEVDAEVTTRITESLLLRGAALGLTETVSTVGLRMEGP